MQYIPYDSADSAPIRKIKTASPRFDIECRTLEEITTFAGDTRYP
jgi:hypothetical protein